MAKKKEESKLTCEIKEEYAVLRESDSGRLIYGSFSWNGREPKDELRITWIDKDGEEHVGKGLAITDDEIKTLYHSLKDKKKKQHGVDFGEIFREAETIGEMRDAGNPTKDGFIMLSYKDGMSPDKLKDSLRKK